MSSDGWQSLHLGDLFANRRERGRDGLPLLSVTMHDGLVERRTFDRKMEMAFLGYKAPLINADHSCQSLV